MSRLECDVKLLEEAISAFAPQQSFSIVPTHNGRMDPTGFEPASATFAECCVAITPRAHRAAEHWNPRSSRISRTICHTDSQSGMSYEDAVARTLLLAAADRVSLAVRSTNRGARPRIFIRYGIVRLASNLAVSRSNQPKPFCTMSSWSVSRELESFTISGKSVFARAARINATQAARRCQRLDDFAQRNTSLVRVGFAATIGAMRECTSPS